MPGFPVKKYLYQAQTPGPILATTPVPTVSCYEVWEDPMVPVRAINMTDALATHPTMQVAQPIPGTETMTSTEKPAASK